MNIKDAIRPSIGPMNDVSNVKEAIEWVKGSPNMTWLNINNDWWYVEIDPQPIKALIDKVVNDVIDMRGVAIPYADPAIMQHMPSIVQEIQDIQRNKYRELR